MDDWINCVISILILAPPVIASIGSFKSIWTGDMPISTPWGDITVEHPNINILIRVKI